MDKSTKTNGRIEYSTNHPALNVKEQISLLKEKGLIITDENFAEYWLSHVSYFRIKNYSYAFKDYQERDGNYLPDTKFEQIVDLYLLDRKLKLIIFEAIENIEVAVKTQISNIFSYSYGQYWYREPNFFLSMNEQRKNMKENDEPKSFNKYFDHDFFLKEIDEECKNPDEIFLANYMKNYHPPYPPSWMLMEILTFGKISILYENLKPCVEKTSIHDNFNLTKKHFTSWLHCFTYIRNKCVHHARLVYKSVKFQPALPEKTSRRFILEQHLVSTDTIYAVLCCLQFMLNTCNNKSAFKNNVTKLIVDFPNIDYQKLGFTPNWRDEPLWK